MVWDSVRQIKDGVSKKIGFSWRKIKRTNELTIRRDCGKVYRGELKEFWGENVSYRVGI